MFHDSQIAKKFSPHRAKLGYSINFEIAPYCYNKIIQMLNNCEYFVLAFDESLNKVAKKI